MSPTGISSDAFSGVSAKYAMTSDLYEDETFGPINVSKGSSIEECVQYNWLTHTFTQSNTFSQTNSFSQSNTFTKSNVFSQSIVFTKCIYSFIANWCNIHSNINFKTFYYTSNYFKSIFTNTISVTCFNSSYPYVYSNFISCEYIIHQYSTYYMYYSNFFTILENESDENNSEISNNLLIGIISGSILV